MASLPRAAPRDRRGDRPPATQQPVVAAGDLQQPAIYPRLLPLALCAGRVRRTPYIPAAAQARG